MRIPQEQFYRRVGVRRREELIQPRLANIQKLELPLNAIIHYVPQDNVTNGPSEQDPLISNTEGRLFIEHVTELTDTQGNPRRTAVQPSVLTNTYRRQNRLFKRLNSDQALQVNPRSVLVINYAPLRKLYRYLDTFRRPYYRWNNIASTVWDTVAALDQRFGWNQYLDLVLPDVIPTMVAFKQLESSITEKTLARVSGEGALDLFDLWLWLGQSRERSHLSTLSEDALSRVNLMVRLPGYFFVINLGLIDQWRRDPDDDQSSGVIEATALQRRFIRLLHGLKDLTEGVTQITPTDTDDDVPRDGQAPESTLPTASTPPSEVSAVPIETPPVDDWSLSDLETDFPVLPRATTPPPSSDNVPVDDQGRIHDEPTSPTLPPVDDESEEVNVVEQQRYLDRVASQVRQLNSAGIMSAGAANRALNDAQSYLTLKDPFGSELTLAERLRITPEELSITERPGFPDRDTVVDKSMLQASTTHWQQDYVKKLMQKDILNAVMSIQNQGVAVKDYQLETVEDPMNHYQIHTLTLKPVRGKQSTVRFRLPVIDEHGQFRSNGVVYKLRTQRADLPIRKVKPYRVALTSYYNKTFVDRSQKAAHDYGRWMTTTLVKRALDREDQRITDPVLSETFKQAWRVPRTYSMLASRFARFTAGEYHFELNYDERHQRLGESLVDGVEKSGHIAIGRQGDAMLTVDGNEIIYRHQGDNEEPLGLIADILEIDGTRAPVEIAEMSVSNKQLPVGFVLGYHRGLSGLIKDMGCEVQRVPKGTRYSPSPDEYALVFDDETLVFSRLDRRATLLFAGLNQFKAHLSKYSVWDFDNQDVYYQILEDQGLGIRYLREIETLFKSWVDPITLGVLEGMGEPTTFEGLLKRSMELLMSDHSPQETDATVMRYRGYERMAGMVYSQLTRAAKAFNARASGGDVAVELNPHAIWQAVTSDPAVSPIEERNPLRNLREQEVMTYGGDGGRSGRSMVRNTRLYHQSDVGVISESTVDSGDVGVIAYFSPDANLTNLRGQTRPYEGDHHSGAKLLSSSALTSPEAAHDDQIVVKLNLF